MTGRFADEPLRETTAARADAASPVLGLVRRRCAELGMSMQELAREAAVSRSHLYVLLAGQTHDPGVRTLARIAHRASRMRWTCRRWP